MGKKAESQIDLTSMSDVTFMLIIFFVIATKFKEQENRIDANLPKDIGGATAPSVPMLNLSVKIFIDKRERFSAPVVNLNGTDIGGYSPAIRPRPATSAKAKDQQAMVDWYASVNKANWSYFNKVYQEMERLKKTNAFEKTEIDAPPDCPFEYVALVLDCCKRSGMPKITFAAKPE
ncbi:MAG: biopolymer transporter ExbD [Planctomycetes bacterium]|nr:biopolymer transporter ExbD [Planctomycetota bacterium]